MQRRRKDSATSYALRTYIKYSQFQVAQILNINPSNSYLIDNQASTLWKLFCWNREIGP